jgi:Protein of unknown function (DUF3486)
MPNHFKIHELLSREELDALESFAREPGRTIDEVETWLLAAGFKISRGAIFNWRTKFLLDDKFAAASAAAKAVFANQAADKDAVSLSDAATTQLSQMIFEQLITLQIGGQIETKELWAASMALKNVIASKRAVDDIRERFDQQVKAAQDKRPGGAITAEDIAAARKAIFGS